MLTEQQQKAREQLANFILDPHQKEIILTGSPGTGKSYLLQDLTGILKEIDALNKMGFETFERNLKIFFIFFFY